MMVSDHVCSARRLQNADASLGEPRRGASRGATRLARLDLSTLAQLLLGGAATTAQPRTGTAGPEARRAVSSFVIVGFGSQRVII